MRLIHPKNSPAPLEESLVSKTIHVKKFQGGRETPDEMHRRLGIRKICAICKKPAAIRIKVYVPLKELMNRNMSAVQALMLTNPLGPLAPLPTIPMKFNGTVQQMLKVSDNGFCDLCKSQAEREAAHGPSWAFVEIDRGPGKDKFPTQVPLNYPG